MVGCTISAAPALRTGEECRGSVSEDGMRRCTFHSGHLYMAKNGHPIPEVTSPRKVNLYKIFSIKWEQIPTIQDEKLSFLRKMK